MKTLNKPNNDAATVDRCAGQVVRIPVTPIGKPRMTRQDRWTDKHAGKGRPAVLGYFAFQDELLMRLPHFQLGQRLSITFYLPMPKSWSQKKRLATIGQPHDQKPDIDNLVKGFMDTFAAEDKHVAILHAEKYWAEKGAITIFL
jgi:Holliday junction resolvase RusA-like endonuclease